MLWWPEALQPTVEWWWCCYFQRGRLLINLKQASLRILPFEIYPICMCFCWHGLQFSIVNRHFNFFKHDLIGWTFRITWWWCWSARSATAASIGCGLKKKKCCEHSADTIMHSDRLNSDEYTNRQSHPAHEGPAREQSLNHSFERRLNQLPPLCTLV